MATVASEKSISRANTFYLMQMEPLKLVVLGAAGAGKTTISNHIADATEIPFEYRPTKGVRILEFEVPNVRVKNKATSVEVELWDCSGDRRYESCWPAMRKDAVGVIFVQGKNSEENIRDLEQMYDYFVEQPKLEPTSCVLFHHDPEKIHGPDKFDNSQPSALARISRVSCNVEEGGAKLKTDFLAFLSTLTSKRQEKSEQEESNIVSENVGIFAR